MEIDYLSEDKEIPRQKYTLVSIVGPNYSQACKMYAFKARGTASTMEEANKLAEKIKSYDDKFDIHVVETGKFVPLTLDPSKAKDVKYQNDQLNEMIKNYHDETEKANNEWHKQKQERVLAARKEGKEGVIQNAETVYATIATITARLQTLAEETSKLHEKLSEEEEIFGKFSQAEQDSAKELFDPHNKSGSSSTKE
jgi:hypothetical protein